MNPKSIGDEESLSSRLQPSSYPAAQGESIEGMNLIDVWAAVHFYRWMVVSIFIATIGVCTAIAVFSTPIYRAEVLLAPTKSSTGGGMGQLARQFGGIASLAGGLASGNDTDQKNEAMALLESRSFLVAFIKDEKLMPVLYPDTWGTAQGQAVDSDWPRYWDAYRLFSEQILDLREDKDTGFLKLGIEWRDSGLAAQWANALVARLNTLMRERAIDESERGIKYLTQELERTTAIDVKQDINQVIETTISQKALAHARQDYAFKVIDPAAVSEPDNFVRPRRLLLIVGGIVMGAIFAVMLALVRFVAAGRHKRVAER